MELKIDVKSFVNAVNWVTKNYDTKSDKAFVSLSINENGEGSLSHANISSYMKSDYTVVSVNFDKDGVNEAHLAIDGNFLRKFAKAIGNVDGELVLTKDLTNKITSLEAKTKSGKFTLPLHSAKVGKSPEIVELGEVDDNEFFDMLNRVAKLCDTNTSSSSMFTGAVDFGFNTEDKKIKLFATDRYALTEVSLDFTPTVNEDDAELLSKNLLLPYDKASIIPASKGVSTSVSIVAEPNDAHDSVIRLGYAFPDGRLALFALLNSATFSGIEGMKKKALDPVEYEITLSKKEFLDAVSVVSSLAWEEQHIYLKISSDGLIVSDSNGSNSLQVDSSSLDYDSDETYTAKFIRSTLNESFSPVSTSDVVLKWGESSSAFVFEPVTEDGDSVDNVFVMSILNK